MGGGEQSGDESVFFVEQRVVGCLDGKMSRNLFGWE